MSSLLSPNRPRPLGAVTLALAAGLLAALVLPAPPALAAEGTSWSVAPADTAVGQDRGNFEYALAPGAVVDDAFEIRNDGTEALTLEVYAADAFTTREGNIDLLPAGTPSTDAGTWVSLGSNQVTLQPGETSVVPFQIRVPADAVPGDHPAGVISSLRSADASAEVQVDRRLGSRLYIRVDGALSPAAEVTDLVTSYSGSLDPFGVGTLDIAYTLTNTGDTRVTATSAVEAAGPFGLAGASAPVEQLAEVLPGSSIDVRQQVTGLAALFWLSGAVSVSPTGVGIGGTPLETVSTSFGMLALPVIPLLALLVVALLVLALVLILRRRKRAAAGRAAA